MAQLCNASPASPRRFVGGLFDIDLPWLAVASADYIILGLHITDYSFSIPSLLKPKDLQPSHRSDYFSVCSEAVDTYVIP